MAAPITSARFKATVAPILGKAFDGLYNENKEWELAFEKIKGLPRNQHVEPFYYGFGAAPDVGDGDPVTYDFAGEQYTSIYFYRQVGLAFALTKVLVDDGEHESLGTILAKHLGKSMRETEEIKCANVLSRGFNSAYPGPDGVSLFNAAHPGVGTTYSNVVTGTLSQTTLETILQNIRNATDPRGKKIGLKAKRLLVPPALMMTAEVLLKSALRAGTADNDINPITPYIDTTPGVMSRLTSNTAWFVKTDAMQGLQYVDRTPLEKTMEGDFETNSMRYKSMERYQVGFTDPRGAFGSSGL
jgi:hypothetical protein